MKTEDVQATEINLTDYLTLILFSVPASARVEDEILGHSNPQAPALASAIDRSEWSSPPLDGLNERSPLHF